MLYDNGGLLGQFKLAHTHFRAYVGWWDVNFRFSDALALCDELESTASINQNLFTSGLTDWQTDDVKRGLFAKGFRWCEGLWAIILDWLGEWAIHTFGLSDFDSLWLTSTISMNQLSRKYQTDLSLNQYHVNGNTSSSCGWPFAITWSLSYYESVFQVAYTLWKDIVNHGKLLAFLLISDYWDVMSLGVMVDGFTFKIC